MGEACLLTGCQTMTDERLPEGYEISTDADRLDRGVIHRYLSEDSYWARGIPQHVMERPDLGLDLVEGAALGLAVAHRAVAGGPEAAVHLERHGRRGQPEELVQIGWDRLLYRSLGIGRRARGHIGALWSARS